MACGIFSYQAKKHKQQSDRLHGVICQPPRRFVCDGTVEDKISSLQEKKKELAQKV